MYISFPVLTEDLECFECSEFPREEDSMDEPLGPCPGWRNSSHQVQRYSKVQGAGSLYDGCLTIRILPSLQVVGQHGVNFKVGEVRFHREESHMQPAPNS